MQARGFLDNRSKWT